MTLSTTAAPLVSVIIPCHNAGTYLAEAIQSALDQTYRPLEVIVVDDASTDHSAEIAEAFGAPVRVLRNERNMERSWSRNRGVKESSGELIAFLDADDVWLSTKLEKQVALLAQQPAVAFAYAKARIFTVTNGERTLLDVWGGAFTGLRCDRLLVRTNVVAMVTAVVRRACFDAVAGFDCTPWVQGCEDYELWLRLAHQFPVCFQDEVLALYRRHSGQTITDTWMIAKTAFRVRRRFIMRHPDVLEGKSKQDAWQDRYQDLAWYASRALGRGEYATAVRAYFMLVKDRPWHRSWWRSLGRAVLGRIGWGRRSPIRSVPRHLG